MCPQRLPAPRDNEPPCPHITCASRKCLETMHNKWEDIKAEFRELSEIGEDSPSPARPVLDAAPWIVSLPRPEHGEGINPAQPSASGAAQSSSSSSSSSTPSLSSSPGLQTLVARTPPPRHTIQQTLKIDVCVSDAGPDISQSRKQVASAYVFRLWHWFFHIDCFAHQYQLLSLESLKPVLLEKLLGVPTSYYSCLAITMHLFRDNIKAVWKYLVDQEDIGVARAKTLNANRVPPRPLSGRWGQASKCESWIAAWDKDVCVRVLEAVVLKRGYAQQAMAEKEAADREPAAGKAKSRPRKRKSKVVDDTKTDEQEAFQQMWGGWSLKALAIAKSDGFWILLKIRRRVGRCLDHLLWSIEKTRYGEDANLAHFVDGKADEIEQDLFALANSADAWSDVIETIDDKFGRDVANTADELIHRYAMHIACSFRRRICNRLATWQCKLLKLAKSEPHVKCTSRLAVASELLKFKRCPQNVDINGRKCLLAFEPELEHIVSSDGQCSPLLFIPLKMTRRHWRCDSQEIEGVMSMIGNVLSHAPHTSLQTLDAKVGTRKSLTYDRRHGDGQSNLAVLRKWSAFKEVADDIIRENVEFLPECHTVMSHTRFRPPPSSVLDAKIKHALVDPSLTDCHEARWAIHFNAEWVRAAKANTMISTGGCATIFSLVRPDGETCSVEAFICYSLYRFSGLLYQIQLELGDDGQFEAQPTVEPQPLTVSSHDLFRMIYRVASERNLCCKVSFLRLSGAMGKPKYFVLEDVESLPDAADADDTYKPLTDLSFDCAHDARLKCTEHAAAKPSGHADPICDASPPPHDDTDDIEARMVEDALCELAGTNNKADEEVFEDLPLEAERNIVRSSVSAGLMLLQDPVLESAMEDAGEFDVADIAIACELRAAGAMDEPRPPGPLGTIKEVGTSLVDSSVAGLAVLRDVWAAGRGSPLQAHGACSLVHVKRSLPHCGGDMHECVQFVQWLDPSTYYGRPFSKDKAGSSLAWSVPNKASRQWQSYAGCDIILADAGVTPVFMRSARPDIPERSLALQRMFTIALCYGEAEGEHSPGDPCDICGRMVVEAAFRLATCAVCQRTCHTECIKQTLYSDPGLRQRLHRVVVARGAAIALPPVFVPTAVCSICRVLSTGSSYSFNVAWRHI